MSDKQQKLIRMPNRIPVANVAAMRLIVGTEPAYDYAIVLGQNYVNDGHPREYFWDADSTMEDDNDRYIQPTAYTSVTPGRWVKVRTSVTKSKYVDITNTGTAIQQDIEHEFDTQSVVVQVYLMGQTINGTADCNLLATKDSLSATLFEIGAKDSNTIIVNMTDIPAGTYRFSIQASPYEDLAP